MATPKQYDRIAFVASPSTEAQAALNSMAAMMKSRGDRSMTAAANAMLGGAPTC